MPDDYTLVRTADLHALLRDVAMLARLATLVAGTRAGAPLAGLLPILRTTLRQRLRPKNTATRRATHGRGDAE